MKRSGVYPPLSGGSNPPLPEHVQVREIASAKGAKLRLPKARSPFQLGSLRERRKLPQRGLGRSPRNPRYFEHFMPTWSAFWDVVNLIRRDFEHFMPNGAQLGLSLITYF